MKLRLPDEVMPTLYLTRDEELAVEKESNAMVRETIDAFDTFIANKRQFPKHQWKHVKSREGFDVFRTRKSVYGANRGSSSRSSTPSSGGGSASYQHSLKRASSSSSSSNAAAVPAVPSGVERSGLSDSVLNSMTTSQIDSPVMRNMKQFPVIVLTGVIPGTMADAAYGNIAADEAIWRLRSTYVNDLHRDCKILATLQRPSKENPFSFLGVKWAFRKLPAFVQQRDLVYSEQSGMILDKDGNIATGFNLMHSVELPGIPELTEYDILRIRISLCFVTRPYNDTSIEIFCRAFCNPEGNVPMTVHAMIYADALLAAVNVIECSNMKKLMWLTRRRQREQMRTTQTAFGSSRGMHATSTIQDLETATSCQGCNRSLKHFGGLMDRSVSVCSCCKRVICRKCSSERKIVLDVSDEGEVTQKPLPFCVQCVVEARKLPALDIAVATAVDWFDN